MTLSSLCPSANSGLSQMPCVLLTCRTRKDREKNRGNVSNVARKHKSCAKFETGQIFQPTTPNILLLRDRRSEAQQCCIRLHNSSNIICWGHTRSLRMDYKDFWVVFFPWCTAGLKLVRNCCIRLHTQFHVVGCCCVLLRKV